MNPTLQDYLMQIQNESNANQQEEVSSPNPFANGIQNAMAATRQSMGIPSREEQEQEARGMGFINFGRALGQPSRNQLEGLNQALGSGMDAYLQQRSQQAQIDAKVYLESVRQQEAEREHARRLEESQARQMMHAQTLEERKRMHEETLAQKKMHQGLTHQYQLANLGLKKKEKEAELGAEGVPGLYGVEYIPLNSLTKTAEREWSKYAAKKESQLDVNKRAIQSVNEMDKIFNKYPDIGSSFLNALVQSEKGGPTMWSSLMRQFASKADEKKLAAIEKLKKSSADIRFDVIMGIQGQKGTDIMKKLIEEASASGLSTQDSFKFIANKIRNHGNQNIKEIQVIQDSQKKGMKPLFSIGEDINGSSSISSNAIPPIPQLQESLPSILAQSGGVSSTVKIQAPDGEIWEIPQESLQGALERGAKQIE